MELQHFLCAQPRIFALQANEKLDDIPTIIEDVEGPTVMRVTQCRPTQETIGPNITITPRFAGERPQANAGTTMTIKAGPLTLIRVDFELPVGCAIIETTCYKGKIESYRIVRCRERQKVPRPASGPESFSGRG